MPELSTVFKRSRDRILEVWEGRARGEIIAGKGLPQPALLNALPLFLEEIAQILAQQPRPYVYAAQSISKEHGRQRADMKAYSIKYVLLEYAILRRVIFEVLEETRPLAPDERDLLYDVILHGMLEAGEEFARTKESQEGSALTRAEGALVIAEEASRARDVLLAVISHELRAPLTPLLGYALLLQGGKLTPAEMREAFRVIEKCVRQETQIVDDLLDVSRIMSGKLSIEARVMDLSAAIEAAVDVIRPAAALMDVDLKTDYPARSLSMTGDAARLQQVFVNLLTNAVKFTPAGGSVTVSWRISGAQVRVAVADTGQGLTAQTLPMIFQEFWQADSSSKRLHGGLGLGLSISRHLVEMHGGTLSCASPGLGRGSTFTVSLPLVKNEGGAFDTAAPPRRSEAPLLAGLRILLVEDEADVRMVLDMVLRKFGALTFAAGSVSEACDLMRREKPDIILTDIAMPGENGFALLAKVRALPAALGGNIPILALTGDAGEADRIKILAAGFTHYLIKPIDPESLVATISDLGKTIGTLAAG
ncbi:MAG: ATP-binding protein [Elusimicrobia bacterium]|nr:ATP-binding protein [Elusimicrobiota bacterium]